jgi:hypothetical protein
MTRLMALVLGLALKQPLHRKCGRCTNRCRCRRAN